MFNRRLLRVKVLLALYAYFQNKEANMEKAEKELLNSIFRIKELYLYMLMLIAEITEVARRQIDQNKLKRLPNEEDLNPNTKFIDNRLTAILENNFQLKREMNNAKVSWADNWENIRKLFKTIQASEEYINYMQNNDRSFKEDKNLLIELYQLYISTNELAQNFLEEKSMHWVNDLDIIHQSVLKTMQELKSDALPSDYIIPNVLKDEADDLLFVKNLFRKTILFATEYDTLIQEKISNWEIERLAFMDTILMKMALCEFEHFSNVPVKVSLNEYIELSKGFSTPKSNQFINGILDKFLIEWKESGRIKKTGRGLIQ
jgi:N utilization substance protein B